jgi:hypothetical protein
VDEVAATTSHSLPAKALARNSSVSPAPRPRSCLARTLLLQRPLVASHCTPHHPRPHLTSPHHRLCPLRRHTSRDHVVRTRRPRRSHARSRPRHQPVSRHLSRRRLQWRAYSTGRPEHLDAWPARWTRDCSQRHHQQQCARARQQVVSSIVTRFPAARNGPAGALPDRFILGPRSLRHPPVAPIRRPLPKTTTPNASSTSKPPAMAGASSSRHRAS